MKQLGNMKLYTLDEVTDELIGKKGSADIYFLGDSLKELLGIFKTVLRVSFDPKRYSEYDLADW